jgi:hypothetical protein
MNIHLVGLDIGSINQADAELATIRDRWSSRAEGLKTATARRWRIARNPFFAPPKGLLERCQARDRIVEVVVGL